MSDEIGSDTGEPDAFMLSDQERRRQAARKRLLISVPLAALTVPVAIAVGIVSDWPWIWIVIGELGALLMVGTINYRVDPDPERPRPDTALEVAVVVGVEIISWGNADGATHTARVIGRSLGSTTDQLIHGYRTFSATKGCHVRPGMLFGFRRHPTMRHLVWTEPTQDPLGLLCLRDGRPWERAETLDAVVESIEVGGEPDGDWWSTTVTVRLGSSLVTDTRPRLPEELAQFEPGTHIQIARAVRPPLPAMAIHALVSRTI